MSSALSPQLSAKTKPVVLRPDDEIKENLRRRNIGRPCPHCHMPLAMGKYITGDQNCVYPQFAYYQCKGYREPETDQRYAGCGGSFKLRVMTEAEQLALLQAGRIAELEDYLRSIDRSQAQKKIDQLATEHLARLTAGTDGATLSGSGSGSGSDSFDSDSPNVESDTPNEEPQYELGDVPSKSRRRK